MDDFDDQSVIQILDEALLTDVRSASAMACIGMHNSIHRANIDTSVDKILLALSKANPLVLAMNKEYVRKLLDLFKDIAGSENELQVVSKVEQALDDHSI